uniref:Phycobiliprotein ApcE n=1 Tax=Acrochaetium secundatum TaxID=209631 RepID=A0A4D6BNA1_9FLOR|nr:phycobilisome linker polypeptide [Acrochaetium secundatum]QBX88449.1 phycobilisome linker polypeptide [Acrochaetium secundatum]
MSINASGGSPVAKPQLYRTASISTITQAEQQDRFLQLGELNQLVTFLNSGQKRLAVADILTKNANILVAKAADKIFTGGSAISYLERPQASFISENSEKVNNNSQENSAIITNSKTSSFVVTLEDVTPPGFKPINIVRYGSNRMKKSIRDLDWFLRYLTYSIIAGDPNILSVNIRGLRDLIDNACSSAAASVALREMRKTALDLFKSDREAGELVLEYFNIVISEFESAGLTDITRKRQFSDVQGLRLPQIYANAGTQIQKFAMKSNLSADEKNIVIKACYRQVFERDIQKGYSLSFSNLESQVKNGQLSIKEFVRALGTSSIYRQQFFEPFVNSRVIELAFRHFLGRGPSSQVEFQKFFGVLSNRGLAGLVDEIINSSEYTDYFGEETVPYLRALGQEPQECRNWGPQINLFNYSAPFRKVPQFITLFSSYRQSLPDQHPYGCSNDPLLIQFGAIFPEAKTTLSNKPAPFGKDTRRLLIRKGPGIYNQISNPSLRSTLVGASGPVIFQLLSQKPNTGNTNIITATQSVIDAVYLRVFGRRVYEEELLMFKPIESKVRDGSLTIRNFVKYLAKSRTFRSLYWEPLYVCKAIEYIHNRLLGRPTYGRQEINQYFNIVYKDNYYQMIDSMVDSLEYTETFGEQIVPYERYLTSNTVLMRKIQTPISKFTIDSLNNRFLKLGKVQDYRSKSSLNSRIKQGVSSQRDQIIIFKLKNSDTKEVRATVLKASYRQIFERDINSFSLGYELTGLESAFLQGELNIKQLIAKLGESSLYLKEFYQPYPNTKVIELGTKHFLGRAPNNQAEIRYYNQILASQGIITFIQSLVTSSEYKAVFGDNTVPYRRFPTLPAANFPNTEKLYNNLTKQNKSIIIPSFSSTNGNQ